MSDIQIIPTILATSEEEYQHELGVISQTKQLFEWVQIDFMDGKFVNNQSVGLDTISKYPTDLKIEAHLMVQNPLEWIDNLTQLGVKRITVHIEAQDVKEAIEKIKRVGLQVGLALSPETPVENLTPFIDRIDIVLILSVHPGFSGQEFLSQTGEKIKDLVKIRNEHNFKIGVDGGVNESVVEDLVNDGVDYLYIGEHLTYGSITENFQKIKRAIKS